ncbi:MAG: 3-dehydroquinate synthase [Acidobacteria bacterium]|nr:3-dehydroquinate synthase [Acidobacteriota bacterium]
MMYDFEFETHQNTLTEFCRAAGWEHVFRSWIETHAQYQQSDHIIIVTDEEVWRLYETRTRNGLAPLNRKIVPLVLKSGEETKSYEAIFRLVDELMQNRVHRRDLLICLGGGVTCDLGGMLALLYMRGLPYISVPTSLLAQIDAGIGGKVGVNFGTRKNLLGGFCHPLLVLLDPGFLGSVPEQPYIAAFAEAIKLAIILDDDQFLSQLEENSEALLKRESETLAKLVDRCVRTKIDLLKSDPFETNLDRVLNLGHSIAHALELLPVMPEGKHPLHGEAVAIGLATKIRYAFRTGCCSLNRAMRLLQAITRLRLPIQPSNILKEEITSQLDRIQENRGGLFRLVLPVDPVGVRILPIADLNLLVECLVPVATLG